MNEHIQELLSQARDTMTVKRVFGEPMRQNGLTIIPAANVWGGAGAGWSGDEAGADPVPVGSVSSAGAERGGGSGFGVRASPAGIYVIKGETVRWEPAFNLNRTILGGQLVMIVLLLTIRAIVTTRARRQKR